MSEVLTQEEWTRNMVLSVAIKMPDEYPDSYATFFVEEIRKEGGYTNYAAGKFADGILWDGKRGIVA